VGPRALLDAVANRKIPNYVERKRNRTEVGNFKVLSQHKCANRLKKHTKTLRISAVRAEIHIQDLRNTKH
jgi:predicted nucleic acid-binding protein